MAYLYGPIQQDQMRLVKFHRGSGSRSAVLQTFPLGEPAPPYYALSYSWQCDTPVTGDPNTRYSLDIGTGMLSTLETISAFVRVLHLKNAELEDAWWWIDSICINLADANERSQQVSLMDRIYRHARDIIIWLGEETAHTDRAVDFIELLNATIRQQPRVTPEEVRCIFEQELFRPDWIALTIFFERRWWSRIWTLQEYAINTKASFWWGSRSLSHFAVEGALIDADQCTSSAFKATSAFRRGFSRRRLKILHEKGQSWTPKLSLSLVALAAYSSCFEATEDRDRLYGIKGLATDTRILDTNYSRSVDETYLQFAKAFIAQYQSLDIICFASIHSPIPESALPSWVPDWRASLDPLSVPLMVSQNAESHIGNLRPFALAIEESGETSLKYTASKGCTAFCKFRGSRLIVRGAIVDDVDGLAGSQKSELVQSSAQMNLKGLGITQMSASDRITAVCKCLVLDRQDRFLRFAMPTKEFTQDFRWMCSQLMTEMTPIVPREFQEWYESFKLLVFQGYSFQDMLRDSSECVDIRSLSTPASVDEYIFDSLFSRFYDTVVRMSLRLMTTGNGRLGTAPEKARKGDFVVVLMGCNVPILLRRSGTVEEDLYVCVGECFINDFMYRAGLDKERYPLREFLIK
jgi:hypothetical protein